MEQPQRKILRIPNFDYGQDGAYFVTVCVQDRRQILSRITGPDARVELKPAGIVVDKLIRNAPEIDHYVVMPDHIHLLIRLTGGGNDAPGNRGRVSGIVRSIKILATKALGRAIFQRSFYDHVIRNQTDYNEVWEYIDGNPMKWAIKKQGWE